MDRDHVAWRSGGRALLGHCSNRPRHDDFVDRRSSFLRAGLFDTTNGFGISAGKAVHRVRSGLIFRLGWCQVADQPVAPPLSISKAAPAKLVYRVALARFGAFRAVQPTEGSRTLLKRRDG